MNTRIFMKYLTELVQSGKVRLRQQPYTRIRDDDAGICPIAIVANHKFRTDEYNCGNTQEASTRLGLSRQDWTTLKDVADYDITFIPNPDKQALRKQLEELCV